MSRAPLLVRMPRGSKLDRDKPPPSEYKSLVPETDLEQALRSFDRIATLVRDRAVRQIWTFEFHGRGYFLYFYPRRSMWRKLRTPGSALGEFFHFQALQKAGVPSPRAVAHLSGFRIGPLLGDALIVEALENVVPLDEHVRSGNLTGKQRRDLLDQLVAIINGMGRLKLGHRDLRLSSFLVQGSKVLFHDASRLHGNRMQTNDILHLGHDAARLATRGELIRAWNGIEPDDPVPPKNRTSPRRWAMVVRDSTGENDDFGTLRIGDWSGHFPRTTRFACPWSISSRMRACRTDWESAWPVLLAKIESGQLDVIKRDPSGEVLSGEVVLQGKPIPVIVKRPRQKIWWRMILDFFRPSRGSRMWTKSWSVIARDIPCEWPMLLMERRVLGGLADSILVFERVPGPRLDKLDLDSLSPAHRESLFFRAGRIQRQLEQSGLINYDTKSSNWIVYDDPKRGPSPIMLDCYGVRSLTYFLAGWGMRRLLRAMRNHKQYTPADSLALCRGFAPHAGRFETEPSDAST